MNKNVFMIIGLFIIISQSYGSNYLLNGGQESQIEYRMTQQVIPTPGIQKLLLSYVIPEDFSSLSYIQRITSFDIQFSKNPDMKTKERDNRGNQVIKVTWYNPQETIHATLSLTAMNTTRLEPIETNATLPLTLLPAEMKPYLEPTEQVPCNHTKIIKKAKQITKSAKTEFDAVQQILTWIVDYMNYVLKPKDYGAIYSIQTGKGNCQNYSHLAATLMRAVGIPVRIVNGVTLKEPYNIQVGSGILTMRMAEGRHSWIEVYFPDLGWVPFDPQQMQLFVSNRFIRVEIGIDNNEAISDGCVRWTRARNSKGIPQFKEAINALFKKDQVKLLAEKRNYGPRKMLLTPRVETYFTEVFSQEAAPPVFIPPERLKTLQYTKPIIFGNLDFPENINFLELTGDVEECDSGEMLMRKNFVVETAEYVTSNGQKYAQTFILQNPLKLERIGLPLHNFGGTGQLWIELLEDDGDGKPGRYMASSEIKTLREISCSPGYRWVDFDFSDATLQISPGRFWIALGYTGSPIVNWFFTYGKPVGPMDGTRYNTVFDETWSRSLSYEFNYRIIGKTVK